MSVSSCWYLGLSSTAELLASWLTWGLVGFPQVSPQVRGLRAAVIASPCTSYSDQLIVKAIWPRTVLLFNYAIYACWYIFKDMLISPVEHHKFMQLSVVLQWWIGYFCKLFGVIQYNIKNFFSVHKKPLISIFIFYNIYKTYN